MPYINILTSENRIIYILFSILPISIIIGSASLNLIVILIDIYFIFVMIKRKSFFFYKIFSVLIIIWFLLILNSIFIANTFESFLRSFGFIRFIIFICAFKFFFEKNSKIFKEIIFNIWFIIFLIVTLDIFIEFFSGSNIFGFKSEYNGRIASFTNDELKIGNYYYGFVLISLTYINVYYKNSKNLLFYSLALLFLITSFLIGERSNFIKVFILIFAFIFFIDNKNFIKKLLIILIFSFVSLFIILNNSFFNSRFLVEVYNPIKEKGIMKFIDNTSHGAHYKLAKKIYEKNKIFGVGIKNFRYESQRILYHSNDKQKKGISTHPHQIHYEFLSETGLVGYIIFLIFFGYSIYFGFSSFFKNKRNIYNLSSALFLITTILPLIPSGSFFTSYTSTIFWINYGFLLIQEN